MHREKQRASRTKRLTRHARRQPRWRSLLFGGRVICLPRIIDESGRNARPKERGERKREKKRDRTTDADVARNGARALENERERTARGEPRNYVIAVSLR